MAEQALSGLKVLDFTTLLPGPLATLILAEAGAEVIKIERPGGEDMRDGAPRWGPYAARFALLNAGKKVLELDLKDPHSRSTLDPLIAEADVLVEQFRPGVMARLGLGYDQLRNRHPGLVYCSITGYGQSGPLSARAGHDLNYMGETGVLALGSGPAQAPHIPPVLAADIAGGSYPAVMNILLALARRTKTGRGMHIDVSMTDSLFPFAFWALPVGWLEGRWPGPGSDLLSGGSPRYRLYVAGDGALVAVAAIEEKFWQSFADAIGLDEQARDDARDPEAVIEAVSALIESRPAAEWRDIFAVADCCCSVVASLAEALESPHFLARGLFDYRIESENGERLTALPVPLDPGLRKGPEQARRAPSRGASATAFGQRTS